jgi:hypothetical protein
MREHELSKKKVLFVTYGGGHVNMILPVAQALQAQGDWQVTVLGLTTARAVLEGAGFACLGFRDIADRADAGDARALDWGRRLSEGNQSSLVPADETIAYLGLSYADLEAEHGVDRAAAIYAAQGRRAFTPVRSLRRLIDRLTPDLVVATNSPRAERAALLAARDAGIPAVCLLDLFPPLPDGAWIKDDDVAQKVCVINDKARLALVGHGRRAADIVVTGNPAFDRHYVYTNGAAERPFAPDAVVVGYASNVLPVPPDGQPDGVLQRAVFERMRQWCVRQGYTLALRQHPSEPPWTDIGPAVDCRALPIETFLGSIDMLITFPSTIALEAQIHGIRVGLLDLTSLSIGNAYLFDDEVDAIGSVAGIDALRVVRAAASNNVAYSAGSATSRVCTVIRQVMERTSD